MSSINVPVPMIVSSDIEAANMSIEQKLTTGTTFVINKAPYLFRASEAGDADVAAVEKIIGGTVAWNQQMREMLSTYYIGDSSSTVSISDGVATVTPTARYSGIRASNNNLPTNIDGHKMLAVASVLSENMNIIISLNAITSRVFTPSQNWQTLYVLINADSTKNKNFRVRVNDASNFSVFYVKNCMVFDLTQMFGISIADYIYALEQSNAGSGVAYFRKLFPKLFYEYNAGSLLSVNTSAHKMTGFNQWDEEWEIGGLTDGENNSATDRIRSKNYIPVVGGQQYYFKAGENGQTDWQLTYWYYDVNKNVIGSANYVRNNYRTFPTNAAYIRFMTTSGYGTTYNNICINLHWDGERDGEYEPYQQWNYPLDSSLTLRGILKLDASNNLYYDGDEYASDGTVQRRYGIVDMGTLDWQKTSGKNNLFNTRLPLSTAAYGGSNDAACNAVCAKYVAASITNTYSNETDKTVSFNATGYCYIEDSAYSDAAAFKTAMSGVYLVYKLTTPTTETADPYTQTQIVDDFGTEEFVDAAVEANERDVAIPVGHETKYVKRSSFVNNQNGSFKMVVVSSEVVI